MKDLTRYRKKRDPASTTEPFSAEPPLGVGEAIPPIADRSGAAGLAAESKGGTWAGRFVVHQHAARRMHWDVRLPINGVLESFAVPQGPSLDPTIKRLAVNTEQHPAEYLDFEDVIPEGNYGAGSMIVWDTGGIVYNETNAEDGVKRGKIDFTLRGYKLTGRFALIATGRRKAETGLAGSQKAAAEWLLIKKPDKAVQPGRDLAVELPRSVISGLTVEELPRREELARDIVTLAQQLGAKVPTPRKAGFLPPMVCALDGAPSESPHFLYELKLDGVRILATKSEGRARLHYRSGKACADNYPDVARALRSLPLDHLVLDGEIVTFDERGQPNFQRLGPRIRTQRARELARVMAQVPVVYLVFDVLEVGHGGQVLDLRSLPLLERNQVRQKVLLGAGILRSLDHISQHGDALWQLVVAQGMEGMVAKRALSTYQHGPAVSGDWVKIKRELDEEFVIVGWTAGRGTRGSLGALCLASYGGGALRYRGRVGSGLDQKTMEELGTLLATRRVEEPAFTGDIPPDAGPVQYVKPEFVVRVRHHGYTDDGHLRAPVFLGLRDDVRPEDCRSAPHDELVAERELAEETESRADDPSEAPVAGTREEGSSSGAGKLPSPSWLTNLNKVFWPEEGYTKGDLISYYEAVAPVMLPFLRGRPVVLVRYPDGIQGKSFYQWRLPEGAPSFMRAHELYDEEKQQARGTGKAAFLVDDLDGLRYIANLGCIPLHVLASRETSPESCDFLTIDFDLGPRAFQDAVRMALDLRHVLTELGLVGFPKTSGQRGLHVLVPLGPNVPFDSAKLLCELLGRILVGRHPAISTMERTKDKRGDKLYVDTGQTGRSRTIVAPYSVRAHPGATVSTPLRWEELHLALDPSILDIHRVPTRIQELGDPMSTLLDQEPDLTATLSKLASWTGR
jgi:bifunctional non-homologous end joining protein LigD